MQPVPGPRARGEQQAAFRQQVRIRPRGSVEPWLALRGGRPEVIDDDMLTFALALRDKGAPGPGPSEEHPCQIVR